MRPRNTTGGGILGLALIILCELTTMRAQQFGLTPQEWVQARAGGGRGAQPRMVWAWDEGQGRWDKRSVGDAGGARKGAGAWDWISFTGASWNDGICPEGDVLCQKKVREVRGAEVREEGWCGRGEEERGGVLMVRNGVILIEVRDARGEAVIVEGVQRGQGIERGEGKEECADPEEPRPGAAGSCGGAGGGGGKWEWQQVPRPAQATRLLGCIGVPAAVAEDDALLCEDESGVVLQRVRGATRGFAAGLWVAIEAAHGAPMGFSKGQPSPGGGSIFFARGGELMEHGVSGPMQLVARSVRFQAHGSPAGVRVDGVADAGHAMPHVVLVVVDQGRRVAQLDLPTATWTLAPPPPEGLMVALEAGVVSDGDDGSSVAMTETTSVMLRSTDGQVLQLIRDTRPPHRRASPLWTWHVHGRPQEGPLAAALGLATEVGSVVGLTTSGQLVELRRVAGSGYTWVLHGPPPSREPPVGGSAKPRAKREKREKPGEGGGCEAEGRVCTCGRVVEAPAGGGVLMVRDDGALVQRSWVGGWFGGWTVSMGPATALQAVGVVAGAAGIVVGGLPRGEEAR
ncbi:hypothetical protein T484DRAFT_1920734 [Baffinella frigidus]|nr:hypothetical protein T484DRAFT_1920734 [Cryptophyta sp. CCMP2293]